MADEVVAPVIEEPKVEPQAVEEAQTEEQIASLMETLKASSVTTSEQLQGKLDASNQAGNLANMVGNLRAEIAELKETKAAPAPANEPGFNLDNLDNFGEGQTIDLEGMMTKVIRKEEARKQKVAVEQQQRALASWNAIQNDEDYGLVKAVWEEKLKDPNFVMKIQTGVTDPTQAYQETVRGYYKGMMKQSLSTIEQLQKSGGKPPIPHVEGGDRVPQNLVQAEPGEETAATKRFKELQEKVKTNGVLSAAEEDQLADLVLQGL